MFTWLFWVIAPIGVILSQNKVEVLFIKAEEYYNNQQLDSALNVYKEITVKYPKHKLYPRAFYNVGYTAWQLDKYDLAIEVFKKILRSNFDDNEKGPGEGLMSEPYAIYKHRSCIILYEIYFARLEYSTALKYLRMADKQYPYQHFCGNEYAANDIYMANQFSKLYDAMGQIDYGLASNQVILTQMELVLSKKYGAVKIKEELLAAQERITLKQENNYEYGYVTLFDVEVPLPEDLWPLPHNIKVDDYFNLSTIERYKVNYINSEFYKRFTD
jgi:tetratricopeptide (TPR) repeat protein